MAALKTTNLIEKLDRHDARLRSPPHPLPCQRPHYPPHHGQAILGNLVFPEAQNPPSGLVKQKRLSLITLDVASQLGCPEIP